MNAHPGILPRCPSKPVRSVSPSWPRMWTISLLLMASMAPAVTASAQGNPPESPSIFFIGNRFFGVPAREAFIGAYTPGTPGYVTIVPILTDGDIRWMQLVPGPRRIFWNEVRISPPGVVNTTYWSARAEDGADRRAEPDLSNATIGPGGQWKYHRAVGANHFARSRLDGSEEEPLGFGPGAAVDSAPFVDPTEQWVYYFGVELQPPPGLPRPRVALFRGNIDSGAAQQLKVFRRPSGFSLASMRLVFDPANDRIHIAFVPIDEDEFSPIDNALYAYDASTFDLIGMTAFEEGDDGGLPRFAIDPIGGAYYFTLGGSVLAPKSLRRLLYGELGSVFPIFAPVLLDSALAGHFEQLDSHPTIRVPEPTIVASRASAVLVVWTIGLARWRRSRPSR